jgi:hypothetical protein
MSYEINVLVNGSRCKQYHHEGKTFIEAKQGSEYTIEIKNNTWQRILAVCSVDGLDILNGKPAVENGNGYVINGHGVLKADGFRVSDEKVAKFLFGNKDSSYAASKEDGSERNVGVIGVRVFSEMIHPLPPPPIIINHYSYNTPSYPPIWMNSPIGVYGSGTGDIMYGSSTTSCTDGNYLYNCNSIPTKAPHITRGGLNSGGSTNAANNAALHTMNFCSNASTQPPSPLGFDIGTNFGDAKESRVIEVEFEKGMLALTSNIFYASRKSLLEMGVPLGNEKQVSFPEPFNGTKYAKPPDDWQG